MPRVRGLPPGTRRPPSGGSAGHRRPRRARVSRTSRPSLRGSSRAEVAGGGGDGHTHPVSLRGFGENALCRWSASHEAERREDTFIRRPRAVRWPGPRRQLAPPLLSADSLERKVEVSGRARVRGPPVPAPHAIPRGSEQLQAAPSSHSAGRRVRRPGPPASRSQCGEAGGFPFEAPSPGSLGLWDCGPSSPTQLGTCIWQSQGRSRQRLLSALSIYGRTQAWHLRHPESKPQKHRPGPSVASLQPTSHPGGPGELRARRIPAPVYSI